MKRLISISCLLAAAVAGAERDDWSNVQALRVGDKVGIVHKGLARIEGEVEAVTPVSITVRAERVQAIEREAVIRVYSRPSFSRNKRILTGVAFGLAAGGAIAAGVAKGSNGEGFFAGKSGGATAGLAIGGAAGLGAAAGAATGGGPRTIYQRR